MIESTPVNISYLILCHDSPERIIHLVEKILSEDDTGHIVIHFDKNSSDSAYDEICTSLKNSARCSILVNRIKCGWGQWSLVEACFKMLEYAAINYKDDYYYLLSEYCYPVKPLPSLKEFLVKNYGVSFVESESSSWIKGGIREDRYLYRHFFNKKANPLLHKYSYKIQKKLFLKKKIPLDISFRFGSQWWCLTDSAVKIILARGPAISKYFKYMWIPDESYIQSCIFLFDIPHVNKSLTYYKFDIQGKATVHTEFINVGESHFFIRKIDILSTQYNIN
jgi:hypothetical protein